MVLSPEEPWGLLCATTLTHGAHPSGLPPLRPLLAAQAGAPEAGTESAGIAS